MENYLTECLESILHQTLKEIEIICIDDGSTDSSYNILQKYKEKYKNIILIKQKNKGAGIAKNRGIECANGKYICFIDPDDYYAKNTALECLYLNAEKNQASICGGNIICIDENDKIYKSSKWFSECGMILFEDYGNYYYYTRYIFSLKLVQENNIMFPKYRRYEDPVFLLNVMIHAQKFYSVNELIYAYRIGYKNDKFSLEVTIDILKGIEECFKIAKKNYLQKTYYENLKNALTNHLGIIYLGLKEEKEEIYRLVQRINAINLEWMGEVPNIIKDFESIEKYIDVIKKRKKKLILECQEAFDIVIFGAGKVGKFVLEDLKNECVNIMGFAVTKTEYNELFEGYKVKNIEDYSRDTLIVVAVGEQYADEVLHILDVLHFSNVCYIEYSILKLLREIENC